MTISLITQADAPIVVDDAGAINENELNPIVGNVLDNDSIVDTGTTLEIGAVSVVGIANSLSNDAAIPLIGLYGELRWNVDGSYEYLLNNANPLVDALTAGQSITETFEFTIENTPSADSLSRLSITIRGVNDAPGALADVVLINEDASLAQTAPGILANDLEVDSGDSSPWWDWQSMVNPCRSEKSSRIRLAVCFEWIPMELSSLIPTVNLNIWPWEISRTSPSTTPSSDSTGALVIQAARHV